MGSRRIISVCARCCYEYICDIFCSNALSRASHKTRAFGLWHSQLYKTNPVKVRKFLYKICSARGRRPKIIWNGRMIGRKEADGKYEHSFNYWSQNKYHRKKVIEWRESHRFWHEKKNIIKHQSDQCSWDRRLLWPILR